MVKELVTTTKVNEVSTAPWQSKARMQCTAPSKVIAHLRILQDGAEIWRQRQYLLQRRRQRHACRAAVRLQDARSNVSTSVSSLPLHCQPDPLTCTLPCEPICLNYVSNDDTAATHLDVS